MEGTADGAVMLFMTADIVSSKHLKRKLNVEHVYNQLTGGPLGPGAPLSPCR